MGRLPFAIRGSNLSTPAISTNQIGNVSAFACVVQTVVESNNGAVTSLSSSSHSSIRCCPPTPRPSTQAGYRLLSTASQESSCSRFSRLAGSLDSILHWELLFPKIVPLPRTSSRHRQAAFQAAQVAHCHRQLAISSPRVFVGLT